MFVLLNMGTMEKLGVIIFMLMALGAFGQHEFVIEGKVKEAPDNSVIQLLYWQGNVGEVIAADTLQKGNFLLRGSVGEFPARMSVCFENDSLFYGDCTLWIGEPVTKIKGKEFCVSLWKVKSKLRLQREENEFVKKTAPITREYAAFRHEKDQEWRAEYKDRNSKHPQMTDYPVTRLRDSLSALSLKANLEALEKCEVLSEVGLERLYPLGRELHYSPSPRITRETVEKLYQRVDPALKNSNRANEIYLYLNPCMIAGVGDEMVDGELFDLEGKRHQLTDYKGKYILLDFWSSACGPCIMAQPELGEIAGEYPDHLNVVSISLDVSREMWRQASGGVKGVNLSDLKGEGGIVARYGYEGMPKFVLISPEGKILEKWNGYRKGSLKERLVKYMNNNGSKNE